MKGLIIISFLFSIVFVSAQVKHEVQPKETLYGLSKQYGVTQEEILNANPQIRENGLQIGDQIVIPASSGNDGSINTNSENPYLNNDTVQNDNYIYVTIQPQETLYNLSKTYGVSMEAIKSLNPNLQAGLKEGDVVRIPKSKEESPEGYHEIQAGETLYTLSRKYDVSMEDILMVNPNLQVDNIQIGQFVKIPSENLAIINTNSNNQPDEEFSFPDNNNTDITQVEEVDVVVETPPVQNGYYKYTVKKGETIFGILTNFNITLDQFIKANPDVVTTIQPGDVVNIPVKSETKFTEIAQSSNMNMERDDTIRVALFLPFFLNDDSKKGLKELSTFFLSGAKLALDSVAAKGKKIKVEVIDSGDEQEFQRTIDSGKIQNADLYVGPVYKSSILALRQKTLNANTPIVSPLVKDQVLEDQPNIIFADVDDETLAVKLMEEIQKQYNGQKIIILTDSDELKLAEYMSEDFTQEGKPTEIVYSVESIKQEQNLITEDYEDLIIVLVSEDENLGQQFIDKVSSMTPNTVTPYSVFYLNQFDKSANISKLRRTGFEFIATRKVDTKGYNEKKTLKNYEKEYCQSPPKYAVMGFDIVYDLLTRMDDSKNILNHMNTVTTQLATKFEYEKLPSNSYQNVGVRIIEYTKLQENLD